MTYDGALSGLTRLCFINLLWTALTPGVFSFWATARARRYLWSHTRLRGEPLPALLERHFADYTTLGPWRFTSRQTGRKRWWLFVSNGLILVVTLVVTLGLGLPIAIHRMMRAWTRNLLAARTLDRAAGTSVPT